MTAKLYLTVYDSDEDGLPTSAAELTSKSLGTVDAMIALDYTHALHGAGQITIKIPRNHTQAALLVQDRYVAVHSDAGVIGGAFLEQGEVQLTSEDEEGGEIVTWTGRGQLAYTERGNLPDITRQEGGEDPDQGTWEWWKQGLSIGATADSLGAMYRRAVLETHDDVPSGIGVLTHDFDFDEDSDGTAWDTSGPVIDSSIGDNLLQVTADFDRFGLFVQMEPIFLLHAYRNYGRDLTGAAFGTGVVRFAAGSNIAAAIGRQLQESVKVTHLRVEGQEFKYKTVVDPDYVDGDPVRWGFLSAPETNDLDTMETLGLANIAARKRQADVFSFPLPDHGDDAANGIYEPGWPGTSGTHFWVGDSITMHTGSGTYDVDDLTYPISAITWHLLTDDAATGDYQVIVEIGDSYYWSEGSEPGVNAGQHGGCQCGPTLRLCEPAESAGFADVACEDLTSEMLTAQLAANGDAEDSGGGQWSGGAYLTGRHHTGAQAYGVLSATAVDIAYTWNPAQVFSAGTRYVVDVWVEQGWTDTGTTVSFGVPGVDEEVGGAVTLVAAAGGFNKWRICWIPSADRTGVRWRWQGTQSLASYYDFDDLQLFSVIGAGVSSADEVGTSPRAARCNHNHQHNNLLNRNADGAHAAAAVSYAPTGPITATNVQDAISQVAAGMGTGFVTAADGGNEVGNVVTDSGAAYTFDLASGNHQDITLTDDCVFTMPTVGRGLSFTHFRRQDAVGGHGSTYSGVVWLGGIAPDFSTNADAVDIIAFVSDGTVWYGIAGANAGAIVAALNDLTDVTTVGAGDGHGLFQNGTQWAPASAPEPLLLEDGNLAILENGHVAMSEPSFV